jgi:hypothetical protein
MKKLYIILILVVAAILVAVVVGIKMYNKENPNTKDLRVDKSVSVDKITSDFKTDSAKARKTYGSDVKVIDLKGVISKTETDHSGQIHVFFKANDVTVHCLMQKDNTGAASKLKENQEVKLKGKYNGYIVDDIDGAQLQLNDCIIE